MKHEEGLFIRAAAPIDAPRVAACVSAAYEHWVPRLGRKPWPMLQDYAAIIDSEIVFLVEAGDQVAGVLVLACTDEGFLLENVAVIPAHRGQGIGRMLLMRAQAEAQARGYASLYLYTNEKMTENISLYRRMGYVEYARRQEHGFGRVFMRKPIGAVGSVVDNA